MTRLLLVADDLTGALDSAASFCGRFGPIPIHFGMPDSPLGPQAAIDLATRDAAPSIAATRSAAVAPLLAQADVAFKKVDSRLRGPWAVELAAAMRHGGFSMCIMAPAFPAQGRTTVDGRQRVVASDGSVCVEPVDPLQAMREQGLHVVPVRAGQAAEALTLHAPGNGARAPVFLFDASTDEELRAIVREVSARPVASGRILWCGSAGLARGLAPQETPRVPWPELATLAIVGTPHPVSREQVARACLAGAHHHAVKATALADARAFVLRSFESASNVLLTFDLAPAVDAAGARELIEACLAGLLRTLPPPPLLVATGGETLLSICRAVRASRLDVDGEASPGIAHSHVRGGPWSATRVLSKSGGFGPPDWLSAVLRAK
jgi:uncharacterized protein YgbK (DUF1537 family)